MVESDFKLMTIFTKYDITVQKEIAHQLKRIADALEKTNENK